MKKIIEYQIIDHGVEHEQYFQGYGISFTRFEDIATGIGDSPKNALEDALDQLATGGWDTDVINDEFSDIPTIEENQDEMHHYVSVRVR